MYQSANQFSIKKAVMDKLIDIILHTDDALMMFASENVYKTYLILFLFIMFETGIILFPFLPGDGLLFSAGVVAATTDLDIRILVILLLTAAILGNVLNYVNGNYLGLKFRMSKNFYIRKYVMRYIPKAEAFYLKHGTSAVILGRFFPILRTYVPFLAGVTRMKYTIFLKNTIIGAIAWILLFLLTGYYIGEIQWVKENYGLIFLFLVTTTLVPFILKAIKKSI